MDTTSKARESAPYFARSRRGWTVIIVVTPISRLQSATNFKQNTDIFSNLTTPYQLNYRCTMDVLF